MLFRMGFFLPSVWKVKRLCGLDSFACFFVYRIFCMLDFATAMNRVFLRMNRKLNLLIFWLNWSSICGNVLLLRQIDGLSKPKFVHFEALVGLWTRKKIFGRKGKWGIILNVQSRRRQVRHIICRSECLDGLGV
jgi:hypothetical protein